MGSTTIKLVVLFSITWHKTNKIDTKWIPASENSRSAPCSTPVFCKVLAVRETNLITARVRKTEKRRSEMLEKII